jgi:AmiR/NasT family two-component response regulator
MGQLAAFHQDLEICATAQEFVEKCSGTQYEVAILPIGVLPHDVRILLRSYLASMELHPSIVLYSSTSTSQHWSGWLEAEDISIIMRPFTEERLRDAISHAMEEFGERSKRRRC